MKIVAFLQCQWVLNPDRVAQIYAHRATTPELRADLNARFLFAGSLTGNRLWAIFGAKACDSIIWEESSTEIAGKSAGVFPADPHHIHAVIGHFRPDVILAFGRVATDAMEKLVPAGAKLISGPHPAARRLTVVDELREMARQLAEVSHV